MCEWNPVIDLMSPYILQESVLDSNVKYVLAICRINTFQLILGFCVDIPNQARILPDSPGVRLIGLPILANSLSNYLKKSQIFYIINVAVA